MCPMMRRMLVAISDFVHLHCGLPPLRELLAAVRENI